MILPRDIADIGLPDGAGVPGFNAGGTDSVDTDVAAGSTIAARSLLLALPTNLLSRVQTHSQPEGDGGGERDT